MKITFISNYINHHQIPLCDAIYKYLGEDFHFIQCMDMEEKRVEMGWGIDTAKYPYVELYTRDKDRCLQLIQDADVLILGWSGVPEVDEIVLGSDKPIIRISERIYREGQWKAISPRGLQSKYKEHIRFKDKPVYLLCAGAYVAADFALIHAYPGKKYRWGYFPPTHIITAQEHKKKFKKFQDYEDTVDLDNTDETFKFIRTDGQADNRDNDKDNASAQTEGNVANAGISKIADDSVRLDQIPLEIMWAGRFIKLKHPEYAIMAMKDIAGKYRNVHLTMIGDGELLEEMKELARQYKVYHRITFCGNMEPAAVRKKMLDADIFLFTSNYLEGWGAVVNEAMNAGCAVIASGEAGCVPYLIKDDINGCVYRKGRYSEMLKKLTALLENPIRIGRMGLEAYNTIIDKWNAENAANELIRFCKDLLKGYPSPAEDGPLSEAPIIKPPSFFRTLQEDNHLK